MSVNLTNALQNINGANVNVVGPTAGRQTGVFLTDTPTVTWGADPFGNIKASSVSSLVAKYVVTVAQQTITFANLPQSYSHLRVLLKSLSLDSVNGQLTLYVNQDGALVYDSNSIANFNSDTTTSNNIANEGHGIIGGVGVNGLWGVVDITFFDYTNPVTPMGITGFNGGGTYGSSVFGVNYNGTTGAMKRLDLGSDDGNFAPGTIAWVYGIP